MARQKFFFWPSPKKFAHHCSKVPRSPLGLTELPTEGSMWALYPGVKQLGREPGHSLSPSGEVKNARSCTSTLAHTFMV